MKGDYRVLLWCCAAPFMAGGQNLTQEGLRALNDTDSLYVVGYQRKNDVRAHFTSQRYVLAYGSKHNELGGGQFSNVVELVGGGFTYKFLDLDLTFSLPKTKVLQTGVQNLTQFRLSGSLSFRRWSVRGYWIQSTGLVASDASGQFVSGPSIDVLNIGIPFTYFVNYRRYSFRMASFQNERQRRSAGSVLIRIEPFFRRLGVGDTPIVPPAQDTPTNYGEQANLRYAYAPGLTVQPGYGYNWVASSGKWFVSPMVFAGGGVAANKFKGINLEKSNVNVEWKGSAALNIGYNGPRWYASLRAIYDVDYFVLDPAYFYTTDLKLGLTVGYRFNHLEKWLPESLF